MKDILVDLSSPALVKAMEANLHAHITQFGRIQCNTDWEEPELKAVITALDSFECYVYQTKFHPQDVVARIKQDVERYRSQGCLPMYWQVCSSSMLMIMGGVS